MIMNFACVGFFQHVDIFQDKVDFWPRNSGPGANLSGDRCTYTTYTNTHYCVTCSH